MAKKFIIRRPDDEVVTVSLDGKEIGRASHDEDGWHGMERFVEVVKSIATALDVPVKEI